MLAMLVAATLAASPVVIKPELLTTRDVLVYALGKPCAVSHDQRTQHHIYWYMATRCKESWCVAKCTAKSGPEFPFWLAYAFEIDSGGAVVDTAPPSG